MESLHCRRDTGHNSGRQVKYIGKVYFPKYSIHNKTSGEPSPTFSHRNVCCRGRTPVRPDTFLLY